MTIKELSELLANYPDDMEIVNRRYSDYEIISEDDFFILQGVDKNGWVMTSHPTMSAENKAREKDYLALKGN